MGGGECGSCLVICYLDEVTASGVLIVKSQVVNSMRLSGEVESRQSAEVGKRMFPVRGAVDPEIMFEQKQG